MHSDPTSYLWVSKWKLLSPVWLFETPWTIACQAPLSLEFSRQEYWSGLPCPSPGVLPHLGIEPRAPPLQVDSLLPEPPGKPPWCKHLANSRRRLLMFREGLWPLLEQRCFLPLSSTGRTQGASDSFHSALISHTPHPDEGSRKLNN